MRFLTFAAVAAGVLCLAGGAQAAELHKDGMTLKEVQAWLDGEGFKSTVKGDSDDPFLSTEDEDGVKFEVHFYDCEKSRCTSIQFSAGFDLKDAMTASKINDWNTGKRYVKAYIDDEGDPWFTYDVNVAPGGTQAALDDEFAVWLSFIPDITEFIGW